LVLEHAQKFSISDISIGKPKKAISKEVEGDFFVRCDPKTDKIIGSSKIMDFGVCSEIKNF
jgi:hypothetical protein